MDEEDLAAVPVEEFEGAADDPAWGASRSRFYSAAAVCASLAAGATGGVRSRSRFEAVVYGLIFLLDALVCAVSSRVVTGNAFQRMNRRVAAFFCLMAVACVAVFHARA